MSNITITKQLRHRIVGLCLIVLLGAVGLVIRGSGSDVVAASASDTGPQPAIESELPTLPIRLFDGSETTLASFEGKPMVINFWASWCPACVAELPDIEALHQELGDDVTFVGIANSDRMDLATALADEVGLSYTLADDPEGEFFRAFELFAMPTTLFVTPQGQIHDVFGGQLNEEALAERIDDLVAAS